MSIIGKLRDYIKNIIHFGKNQHVHFGKNISIRGHVKFGNNISLDNNVEVRNLTDSVSTIGNNVSINRNTVLRGKFSIGNNVAIAPNCMIIGANHNFSDVNIPIKQQGVTNKGITIADDVWIGANSVILDGVTIGRGVVIGAGSVVTKDVPEYSVAVGNPCRVIKKRI